jgi:hypothetical protein
MAVMHIKPCAISSRDKPERHAYRLNGASGMILKWSLWYI